MVVLKARAALLLIVAAASLFVLTGCGTAVPDTKGMTVDQATKAIEAAGFQVGKVNYDERVSGAVGAVIVQEPAAGKRTKDGSLVLLTVAGPPPVKTPNLAGLDAGNAQAALEAAGLSLGDVTESWDSSIAAGLIAAQEPSAGAEAPGGSPIQIVISKGPTPVAVPETLGMKQAIATETLVSSGFKATIKKKADKAKKGTVIAQKPESGEAQPGSTVVLTVSTGVEMVKVPSLKGTDFLASESRLKRLGFRVVTDEIWMGDSNTSWGTVGKQRPAGGTMLPKGSTVTIWVSLEYEGGDTLQ